MSGRGVFYNDNNPYVVGRLRRLSGAGLIDKGYVDERSIVDVRPADVAGFRQCHFFAGIGGWAAALQLAGWGQRPVWTASLPCQPFSIIGRQQGTGDSRHLWPVFSGLVRKCEPAIVFGEQVASPLGHEWLCRVFSDFHALGYATAGADLCAAGVGAPHIRQRFFWVAWRSDARARWVLEHASGARLEGHAGDGNGESGPEGADTLAGRSIATAGVFDIDPWAGAAWVECSDGKWRRLQPGLTPLVDGLPDRVGRIEAYGNAIVPQVAATFVQFVMEWFNLESEDNERT